MPPHACVSFIELLGIEHRPSCLQDKHSINRAVLPSLGIAWKTSHHSLELYLDSSGVAMGAVPKFRVIYLGHMLGQICL